MTIPHQNTWFFFLSLSQAPSFPYWQAYYLLGYMDTYRCCMGPLLLGGGSPVRLSTLAASC